MHDVQLQSLKADLSRMAHRLAALESEVQQLRRIREPVLDRFVQVRWAVTCEPLQPEDPEEDPVGYPEAGTVFPIKFLDAHFVAELGDREFSNEERSEDQQWVAYHDSYLLVDTKIVVFWQRGLGDDANDNDYGVWWVLKAPTHYYGKLTQTLAQNGSALMEIWRKTDDGWEATGQFIDVFDWFLRFADDEPELEPGTGLRVSWHDGPLADDEAAGFVVDESSCLPDDFFEEEEE
jgi:hypothetical protein